MDEMKSNGIAAGDDQEMTEDLSKTVEDTADAVDTTDTVDAADTAEIIGPEEQTKTVEEPVPTEEQKYCLQCNAEILPEQEFCPKCGTKVGLQKEQPGLQKPAAKKLPIIIGAVVGIIALVAVVLFVVGGQAKPKGPDFEAIYNEYCDSYFSKVASDGSYLTIDTNPNDTDGYSNDDAILAIFSVNEALGLPESVINKMSSTRALDGMQTYTGDGVEVSWTYHPNNGLEIMYSLTK